MGEEEEEVEDKDDIEDTNEEGEVEDRDEIEDTNEEEEEEDSEEERDSEDSGARYSDEGALFGDMDVLPRAKRVKKETSEDLGLVTVRDNIPDDEFEREGGVHFVMASVSHDFKSGAVVDRSHDTVAASDLGPVALILVPTRELAM